MPLTCTSRSGFAASNIRNMAVRVCIIIPTKGIHAIQDVTIPRILPVVEPSSFFVKTSVTICNASIIANGTHKNPITIVAPKIGIAKTASIPPVTHFKILETDIHNIPIHLIVICIILIYYITS